MRRPSAGPLAEDLCLPPLPEYQVIPAPGDPDLSYVDFCREQGDQIVVLSVREARCLIRWFKSWHPDTLEIALRYISDIRADEGAEFR